MTVSERSVGGVTILMCRATLRSTDGAEQVRDKVRSVLQQGQKHCSSIWQGSHTWIAPVGGASSGLFDRRPNRAGKLEAVNPTKRLHDLLVITKLATVFDSFDDEAAAVASFGS